MIVTVTVEVLPFGAFRAVTVNVDVVDAGLGLNEPLIPLAKPDAESDTGLVNPLTGVSVRV